MLNQQSTIRIRREEGKRCEEEAIRLKREADSACLRGTRNRELGLPNNNLLQEAERKQREALAKERDARDLEKLASEGEKNIHRLADQLLINARQRQDVERERQIEESRVSEIAQNLERYKWEIGNCQTTARYKSTHIRKGLYRGAYFCFIFATFTFIQSTKESRN